MAGLPHDATKAHVELAHAVYDRIHIGDAYGRFFAKGHVYGRRYQDFRWPGGASHRVWDDGEVQRLSDSPPAAPEACE